MSSRRLGEPVSVKSTLWDCDVVRLLLWHPLFDSKSHDWISFLENDLPERRKQSGCSLIHLDHLAHTERRYASGHNRCGDNTDADYPEPQRYRWRRYVIWPGQCSGKSSQAKQHAESELVYKSRRRSSR